MKRHLLLGFLAALAFGIFMTGCTGDEQVEDATPEQTTPGDNTVTDDGMRDEMGTSTDLDSGDLSTDD